MKTLAIALVTALVAAPVVAQPATDWHDAASVQFVADGHQGPKPAPVNAPKFDPKHSQRLKNPGHYGLPPAPKGQHYVHQGKNVYRVTDSTMVLVASMGAIAALAATSH